MPRRIQRKHKAGWRAPLDAQGRKPKYVGRGTRWGNPWVVVQTPSEWAVNWAGSSAVPEGLRDHVPANDQRDAHALAVELYETWLYAQPPRFLDRARRELAGRDLMCWCPVTGADGVPVPCHGDVLLEIANG